MSCFNSVTFYACMSELTQGYFSLASVHLPRIGYNTPSFNWYGTERLVRKYLASKGIETSMYPYLILDSEVSSTRIRNFLKTKIFSSFFEKMYAFARSVFELSSPVHTKTLER